jgi:hypothetical protein
MEATFTWDPSKARKNLRIHGVSFDTAKEAFSDPRQVVVDNYFIEAQGEQRQAVIGMTRGLALLLVVFEDRTESDVETIHLIYARKAEKYETEIYTAYLKT